MVFQELECNESQMQVREKNCFPLNVANADSKCRAETLRVTVERFGI